MPLCASTEPLLGCIVPEPAQFWHAGIHITKNWRPVAWNSSAVYMWWVYEIALKQPTVMLSALFTWKENQEKICKIDKVIAQTMSVIHFGTHCYFCLMSPYTHRSDRSTHGREICSWYGLFQCIIPHWCLYHVQYNVISTMWYFFMYHVVRDTCFF